MSHSHTQVSPTCLGVVSDPPCPLSFVQVTNIDGNLIVKGDKSLGRGGNFRVEGPCSDDGCRESGEYLIDIDGETVVVKSAGPVVVEAGNSDVGNGNGSDLSFKSGDGVNPVGGTGGDVFVQAGYGAGGKMNFYVNMTFRSLITFNSS